MIFKPGFRLSLFDGVILVAGTMAALILGAQVWWLGVVIGFVVGHFFLFCNVFRISRKPELVWATVFMALTGSTLVFGKPAWVVTFVSSSLIALVLTHRETRKPSYHGIGWQRLNPSLREWWENQSGT